MAKRTDAATKTRLSPEVIVAAAVSLADAEGLEAVTVRRLAQEHGVTPMAMYWHFNDKDALLDGIAEYLVAAVKLPEPTDEPWDVRLRDILEAFLAAIRPHPNVAGLALKRILSSEPGLVMAERALGLLRQAGFAPEQSAEIGSFLLCAVITLVTNEPGPHRPIEGEARAEMIRHKRAALEALSPARYPNVLAAAPFLVACSDEDSYFAVNLDLLVQGVRAIRPA
ncbi:MAG TPA: TetR/AcrR family transcriptional regulator C-terminal domain-containing protein [Actinoplanes sp.]|jgi:AcrR family transcriptional regulator|nr:TetR/AcrR family transcriptional regulator C-terminal domain-containing protein [Actinoplanes sp.]